MDPQSTGNTLLLACRFALVPYDQWLITHFDTAWTIKQVKQWILSKCNLVHFPDLPRHRPVSPIEFASLSRPKDNSDWSNGSDTRDDAGDDFSDSRSERNREPIAADNKQSNTFGRSPHISIDGSAPTAINSVYSSSDYTLVSFSTAHILEDEFPLFWYNLRPYELLEIHPAGSIVNLPRQVLMEYILPYFEARVKALRVVRGNNVDPKASVGVDSAKEKNGIKSKISKGNKVRLIMSDPLPRMTTNSDEKKDQKKRRAKLEWRERWVIIHQGVLNLCQGRLDPNPSHRIPLTSLTTLRGAEHLAKASVSSIVTGQNIICAKFYSSSSTSHVQATLATSQSAPPSPRSQLPVPSTYAETVKYLTAGNVSGLTPNSPTDDIYNGLPKSKQNPGAGACQDTKHDCYSGASASINDCESENKEPQGMGEPEGGEWIIIDMCDENAFTSILRIIHRHASHQFSSSFLPRSSNIISNTPIPSSPHFPPLSFISPFSQTVISSFDSPTLISSPYPEWRITLVNQARKAGMGDVGRPMECLMWGGNDESRPKSALIDEDAEAETGANGGRLRRDMIGIVASEARDSTIGLRDQLVGLENELDADNEQLSDVEWEGWMRDLDRQVQVEEGHRLDVTNRGNSGITPLSSLSSTLTQSFRHRFSSTPAFCPPTSSYNSLSTSADFASQFPEDSSSASVLPIRPSRGRTTTVTSTVNVGTEATPSRQRSCTVTTASMDWSPLRKKEKGKDKAKNTEPTARATDRMVNVDMEMMTSLEKPVLPQQAQFLTFSNPSCSAQIKGFDLPLPSVLTHQQPRRISILRHIRSASNLGRIIRGEGTTPTIDLEHPGGIGRGATRLMGLVRGP